jgi:hypothetical protein
MANVPTAFETGTSKAGWLKADDQKHYQRIFETQAARSYLYLSLGIGLIAALLPILLMLAGGYRDHDTISSYYTKEVWPSRDILVGSLCAVGVFLFLFHGLSKWENWLLNLAGVAVIAVALIPMTVSVVLHRGFAIVFFVLIGIVAIFFSKKRVERIPHKRTRRAFIAGYTAAGAAMIVLPLVIAALQLWPISRFQHWMFWIECAAIASFSAYWILKTAEYRLLLRIRWMA